MVICFVALPVAAVMSVVSVKYRPLAKEAFDCVFRKLTLRKCNTGLDVRLKSSITSAFLKANRPVGKFIHKYFEPISWLFVILTLTSGIGTIYGGYNFYLYGNCNGPQDSGFCIFDPTGHNEKTTDVAGCSENEAKHMQKDLIFSNFDDSTLPKLNRDAKTTVVMIACYDCDYSRESKQTIDKLIHDNNVNFVFAHFPVKNSSNIASRYGYCINQISNDNFCE